MSATPFEPTDGVSLRVVGVLTIQEYDEPITFSINEVQVIEQDVVARSADTRELVLGIGHSLPKKSASRVRIRTRPLVGNDENLRDRLPIAETRIDRKRIQPLHFV
jgi:hypothetical protein